MSPVSDRKCGAIFCHQDADVEIRHPRHGKRTVCEGHAMGYEVIADV